MNADSDQDGQNVTLICDGSVWTAQSGGGGAITVPNPEDCDDGEPIVWSAAHSEFRCPLDITPDPFAFVNVDDADQSTIYNSNIVQINGIDNTAIVSISGDGVPQYRVCADASCSAAPAYTSTSGSISNGEYIQLQMSSSSSDNTTNTATVNVGTEVAQWLVTTAGAPQFAGAETATAGGTAILSIDKPPITVEDNLMIAALSRDDSGCAMSAPVGWTQIRQGDPGGMFGGSHRYAYFYKLAAAGEPPSYDFLTCDDGEDIAGAIITISGNSTSDPIDVNAGADGDSPTATASSITTTVDNVLLVAIAVNESGGSHSPPSGYTEQVYISRGSGGQGASLSIATRVQVTAGATGAAFFSNPDDWWHVEHIGIRGP